MDIHDLAKFTLSLFAIVDPVGIIPVFLASTNGFSETQRRAAAWVASITVFGVLSLFALAGTALLDFFGVRLASFAVGGGFLLLLLAISMAQARVSPIRQTPEEAEEALEKEAVGAVPLGVPLLAGPGAITHVIVSSSGSGPHQWLHHVSLLPSILLVSFTVWLSFRLSPVIARRLGTTGIHVVTRLMGLIIAAISVEMIARGLVQLFPGLLG